MVLLYKQPRLRRQPLEKRLSYKELLQKLHSPGNGLRDIYKIDISVLNLAK
jgi:hypothetical protein